MATKLDKTTVKEIPSLILKGFLMGAADVVPGVSGGTMALILGIYNRLLNAIKSVSLNSLKLLLRFNIGAFFSQFHWLFLSGLVSGIFGAIIFFTRIVPLQELMFTHPEPVYGLYFGLIIGSIFLLIKGLKQLEFSSILFIAIGAFIGWWVVNLVPTQTPESMAFIFGSGALAISAMILPGISGSFILLILGKYQFILSQVGKIGSDETVTALSILAVFATGMLIGITVFSRFLSWLLSRFNKPTLSVLIGFLIGTLSVIWPFQERTFEEIAQQKTVAYTDPIINEIKSADNSQQMPEFYRIVNVINPDDLTQNQLVIIEKVKRKLIHSDPFIPSLSTASNEPKLSSGEFSFYAGFGFMLVGLLLVFGIDRIAEKEID